MRARLILAATIAALSVGTYTVAQPDGRTTSRATGSVHTGTPEDGPGILSINIDYPGGTVADFLQEVRRVSGYENIVIKDGLDVIKMPSVKLHAVPLYDIIDAVKSMTDGGLRFSANGPVIVCWPDESMSTQQKLKRASHVWSLREIIDSGGSADDALAAVELAAAMSPGESDLKFHQATGLLFAMGTHDDLEVIDRTIDTLTGSYRSSVQQSREVVMQNQQLEGVLKGIQRELADAQDRLKGERQRSEALLTQLDEIQTQKTATVTELQVRLEMMQQENDAMRIKLQQLEAMVADRPGN